MVGINILWKRDKNNRVLGNNTGLLVGNNYSIFIS